MRIFTLSFSSPEAEHEPRFLTGASEIRLNGGAHRFFMLRMTLPVAERSIGQVGPPLRVRIQKDDVSVLAQELKTDSTAKLLDICSTRSILIVPQVNQEIVNGLDEKVSLLGPALRCNKTLEVLRLGYNNINASTVAALADALEHNNTLACLTMPGMLTTPGCALTALLDSEQPRCRRSAYPHQLVAA